MLFFICLYWERSIYYIIRDKPATQHQRSPREPRNWSIKRRSKSSRTASDPEFRTSSPIDLSRQPHQRMAKVDDLLERRAKQVVLAIRRAVGSSVSSTANLAV